MVMYMLPYSSLYSSHPLLPLPHCVHKSALCVCISAAALQIGDITKFPKGIVGASVILKEMTKPHLFTFVQHVSDLTIT